MDSIKKKNLIRIITAIVLCLVIVAIPLTIKLYIDGTQDDVPSEDTGDIPTDEETVTTCTITISISAKALFGENGAKYIDKVRKQMGEELFAKLNNGTILAPIEMTVDTKLSLRDIMEEIEKNNGIIVNGAYNYITSIGGLAEKMASPRSGWMYTINGEYKMISVNSYYPKDGDIIVWNYAV